MPHRGCVLLALILSASGLVHAQDDVAKERVQDLIREFRELSTGPLAPRPADQIRLLQEIANVEHAHGTRFLLRTARTPKYRHLRADLLAVLSAVRSESDRVLVGSLMREHMDRGDSHRRVARAYLAEQAIRERNHDWLSRLFTSGTEEDRFVALKAMGIIESPATLASASRLTRDRRWKPVVGTDVGCGTIVASVKRSEGPHAARLLLLLARDPRFTEADAVVLRETTRLWRQRDLRRYIRVSELAYGTDMNRIETAMFFGLAGLDDARSPLLRMARNTSDNAPVRAAAAQALGGLSIAKGALAVKLGRLAQDDEEVVRQAAIEGLERLGVRQAASALVVLLARAEGKLARAALSRMTGLPLETDWVDWFENHCSLPEGT